MFQMLDTMLVMYIDLPSRMNPGVSYLITALCSLAILYLSSSIKVFLASSDIILLYNGAGLAFVVQCSGLPRIHL